jgi:hypothetical protein
VTARCQCNVVQATKEGAMPDQYQYLDGSSLQFFSIFAGVGLILRIIRAIYNKEKWTDALIGCVETVYLTFAGGLLAHTFMLFLWKQAHDPEQGAKVLYAAFFPLPGIGVVIAKAFGAAFQIQDALLGTAAIVGCFIGMMDGIYGVQPWIGGHIFLLGLDVTWDLAGSTYAALVHIIDTFVSSHAKDGRKGQHIYTGGFAPDGKSAFTIGNVISNLTNGPADSRYGHETIHLWLNRVLGLLYIWSYIGWFIVFGVVIGFLVTFIKRVAFEADSNKASRKVPYLYPTIVAYGYDNNPWEALAGGTGHPKLVWNTVLLVILAVVFYGAFLFTAYQLVRSVWP